MAPGFLTPLAILMSGTLIAAAVYFRPTEVTGACCPDSAALGTAVQVASPGRTSLPEADTSHHQDRSAAGSAEEVGAEKEAARTERLERARQDVTAQMEAAKGRLAAACWAPALRREAQPATFLVNLQIGFNDKGEQVGWALQEIRGKSRPDVAQCLRGQNPRLKIEPPGEFFRWTGSLNFP